MVLLFERFCSGVNLRLAIIKNEGLFLVDDWFGSDFFGGEKRGMAELGTYYGLW